MADHQSLKENLIRFHVVANSDSPRDQEVKLLVRDAVLESIRRDLSGAADVEQAKQYLAATLPKIQDLANAVLDAAGFEEDAVVSFCKEAFPIRKYDTFTLPSGVYQALRIQIGAGEGHNWWCVSFPNLCLPQTQSGFADQAVGAGFSQSMAKTLTEEGYEFRFFLLDALGKAENYFFRP